MRKESGKLGFICLALIIALGGTGLGYAYWSHALTVSGQVETGQLDWELIDYDCYCLSIPHDSGTEIEQAQPAFGYYSCISDLEEGLCNLCDCDSVGDLDCRHLSRFRRHQLAMLHCECCNCCSVEGVDTNDDGNIDKLEVTLTGADECSPGILWFNIHNDGTIPAKITGVEITADNFTAGEEVEVCKIIDPTDKQLDPRDDPDTWRDETKAFCLIGILIRQAGSYCFEVSVDADYWNAP